MTSLPVMTATELLGVSVPHKRVELVCGVLQIRDLSGYLHGLVTTQLAIAIYNHAEKRNVGLVVIGTGFQIAADPDTVRAPDVAFIRRERAPDPSMTRYPALAPDLVVEVLSFNDQPGEVLAKVGDWLSGGARLVWVIDPERRVARVYRADGSETIMDADGLLEGEDVLPGFSCPLASIL